VDRGPRHGVTSRRRRPRDHRGDDRRRPSIHGGAHGASHRAEPVPVSSDLASPRPTRPGASRHRRSAARCGPPRRTDAIRSPSVGGPLPRGTRGRTRGLGPREVGLRRASRRTPHPLQRPISPETDQSDSDRPTGSVSSATGPPPSELRASVLPRERGRREAAASLAKQHPDHRVTVPTPANQHRGGAVIDRADVRVATEGVTLREAPPRRECNDAGPSRSACEER